ncbi:[protein-PII] uridylyltransferase [Gammaproteobacteria bacterium]|nr:[protein-PII] uridylyltransferase [Gammaproteobacteria bacterium]
MNNALEAINQDFEEKFHFFFQKPELIQGSLNQRSKEFDLIITAQFKKLRLDNDFALVALGGYGRNELFPGSDIDLSIIQLVKNTSQLEEISNFISWLWTLNVKIGHSVRTIKDIEKITKSDLKEFTSHLSNRIIFCHPNQKSNLTKALSGLSSGWSKSKFYKAKKLEQLQRFASFDSTEFSLEPDLKESPGCLRDFQTALWILEHCFEVKSLMDCSKLNLFSRKYLNSINESYCHIKCLRFLLNLHADSNRISFENQLLLAKKSKLKDSKKSSAVESFMRIFFLHAANLSDFNEMVFQAYEDQGITLKRPYTNNFYIFRDRIGIHRRVDLCTRPGLVLEGFLQIGRLKNINGFDFESMKKIREVVPTIDPNFFLSQEAGNQFIDILKSQTSLSTILKKMKQLGILKLLIPEFGAIEGQMQFDMFHIYSVDEHTFKVVRNMRQMQIGKIDGSMKIEQELINKLPKIELLYLAGIFHDLGKGKGGDHSEIGEGIVTKFCKRLSFSIHDTKLLGWLVRNHLIMSSISQKTDVHDPQTIEDFTKIVNSIEKLNYIYILTINDIRGTNPTLWNSWKHDLLKELFLSSRRKLNFEDQESHKLIIAERKKDSLEGIEQKALPDAEAIWAQLPNTYFSKYQIEQLHNQALVVANANFEATASVIKRKNLLEIFIFTPNQEGLFFKTAKALESLSLETIDANIHTTNDGAYALNTFICKHKVLGSNLTKRDELGIQQKIISKLTSETKPKEKQSIGKLKKVFEHKTRVEITELLNPASNLVTLETLDQPALLSQVAFIFYENGINVISSRITTLGEKVEDNFLVVDAKKNIQISKNKEEKVIKKLKNL